MRNHLPLPPQHIVGVDLGQASDPTAICVLARTLQPSGRFVPDQEAALVNAWSGYQPLHEPQVEELLGHYAAIHLERLPLGTPYPAVVQAVAQVVEAVRVPAGRRDGVLSGPFMQPTSTHHPPLPVVAVDGTGVGRPVVDMLLNARLVADLVPILITGGSTPSQADDGYVHVPKRDLIGVTRMLLDAQRLRWAAGLPEARVLEAELANFRTKLTANLTDTYNAREGAHDDLLLALACAAWVGEYVL